MVKYGVLWEIMLYHGMSWYIVVYRGISIYIYILYNCGIISGVSVYRYIHPTSPSM